MKLKPAPEIILRNGKPSAVILDIDVYEDLLEQLEQKEDLQALAEARKKPSGSSDRLTSFWNGRRSHV